MSELGATLLAALPGLVALVAGAVRWRAWREPRHAWRRPPLRVRLALLALVALALASCHTTHGNHWAKTPVPLTLVPFNEPVRWTIGPDAGREVPNQNGLLASYFAGAMYDRLDHQQIDPNVDFTWNADGQNPVIPGATVANEGLDRDDCFGFCGLPPVWGIWSIAWEGYLETPIGGSYGLRIHVNNGGWLEMKATGGGLQPVIGDCAGHPGFEGECDATIVLDAGRHYIRFSYFQNGPPSANAFLMWSPPGAERFQVVPTTALWTQSNSVPVVDAGADLTIFARSRLFRTGLFSDPDAGQTWSATVDVGDGRGALPLDLTADRTFAISHVYERPGTYVVRVEVRDSGGGVGTARFEVMVRPVPVVFIPGIFGSELATTAARDRVAIPDGHGGTKEWSFGQGQLVWFDLVRALNPFDLADDYFDLLRFTDDGVAPLVPEIRPNGRISELGGGYRDLDRVFRERGYERDRDVFFFAYDWRYAPQDAAVRTQLDAFVQSVRAKTGSSRIDLITHSLGGLVARGFLVAGVERDAIDRVVMLAAPHLGTPLFAYTLLGATCLPPLEAVCIVGSDEIRDVARTMPSAAALAPSAEYYRIFDGGLSRRHPSAYVDQRTIPDLDPALDFATLISRLREAGVADRPIEMAAQFHADDRTWIERLPSGVDLTLVAGSGFPTPGQILERRRIVVQRDLLGRVTGYQIEDRVERRDVDGDFYVVTESASLRQSLAASSRARVLYEGRSHVSIADGTGLGVAFALMRGDDPVATGLARRDPLQATGMILSTHSPVDVVVSDSAGRSVGSSGPTAFFAEIPNALYDHIGGTRRIGLFARDTYRVTLRGIAEGEATVRLRQIDAGVVVKETVFDHVPVRGGTRGAFGVSLDGAAGDLSVDIEGDGRVDLVIRPAVLTGDAADDLVGPRLTIDGPAAGQDVVGTFRLSWRASDDEAGVARSFAIVDRGGPSTAVIEAPGMLDLPPGPYRVEVVAEDRASNATVGGRDFVVVEHEWLTPLTAPGRIEVHGRPTVPVRFAVRRADATLVDDPSVVVELHDTRGQVVAGPFIRAHDPPSGVVLQQDAYHANVPTKGLADGTYVVVARFGSASLTGQISLQLLLR